MAQQSAQCSLHVQSLRSGDAPDNQTSSSFDFLAQLIHDLLVAPGEETEEMLIWPGHFFFPRSPTQNPLLSHHWYVMCKHLPSKEFAVYFKKPHRIERS